MPHVSKLLLIGLAVIAVNLPFGFWRTGVRRFSLPWFFAVHAPVPLVIGFRLASGIGWQPATFPLMVGAYVVGQLCGGRMGRWWRQSYS